MKFKHDLIVFFHRKLLFVVFMVACVFLVLGCSDQKSKEPANTKLKVGFITVGPVNDAGYNASHKASQVYAAKVLADRIETTLIENIPEGADVERVMEHLISQGYSMLFPTSFGYLDPTLRVAKKHPEITFMHCGGFKNAPNVGTYFAYLDEPFYLSGMVAGKMTKSNKLGFVAAHPIPNILREINAFTLGAQSLNPEVSVHVVWTNSWSDPAKEAEAANSLVDSGIDVLAVHQDSPISVVQTGETRGVFVVGCHMDLSSYAAKGWLTGAEWNWGKIVVQSIRDKLNGTWKNTMIRGGLKEGYVKLSSFGPRVPPELQKEVLAVRDQIKNGTFKVFSGLIRDRDGQVRLEEGQTAGFDFLEKMDWFVTGVKGPLPK